MRVLPLPAYLWPVAPVMGTGGGFNGFFLPSPNGPGIVRGRFGLELFGVDEDEPGGHLFGAFRANIIVTL